MTRFLGFFGSMAGRIFLLLSFGMAVASILSLLFAEQARRKDYERIRLERVVASTADIAERLRQAPADTQSQLAQRRIIGAHLAPESVAIPDSDPVLVALLTQRLGERAEADAGTVPVGLCFPRNKFFGKSLAAGVDKRFFPDCWIVRFTDARGTQHSLAIDLPPVVNPPSWALNPIYLLIIFGASAALSILVARAAARPLRRLEQAARDFSVSLDPDPIPERGPEEVRTALATFNLMQSRVQRGFRERTHMLAAISHDLQTPLTRLRLRLEQVDDPALRERLVADLAATRSLVQEGLELARSSESSEGWSMVDIDSLLASLAEDAAEFGAPVAFTSGCGGNVRVKPNALSRCLTNLIDNAVHYGGGADISCIRADGHLTIMVRDHGPGIADDRIEAMFAPFVRGETSRSRTTGGTGIGLTIARAQAHTFGASVTLANHPSGGLIARVDIPAQRAGE